MINSVTLKNFRGYRETTIPLSQVTLLTGTNGVGKTSVLEGIYCLFSETRLDVSPLVRYNRTRGIPINQQNGIQNMLPRLGYNYRLFWQECPMSDEQSCSVSAKSADGTVWQWTYNKAKMSGLEAGLLRDAGLMGIPIDMSSDVALFKWQLSGITLDKKTHQKNPVSTNVTRAQVLSPDGALRLIPPENNQPSSGCVYLDFASIRAMPHELPFQKAKKLTEALKIIDPLITDVRISKIDNGLSVIIGGDKETTLGTIGNGAVTWASTLIAILEVVERFDLDRENMAPIFILIDEIGAGIHYSVMGDIWKYIRDLFVDYPNIQLIATSHSDDCVRAFCDVFDETKNTACIVRLHKTYDEEIVPTKYDATQFDTILSGEWEVRG